MDNLDPYLQLPVTLSRFMSNSDQTPLMSLEGPVSVPVGTRIEIWEDGSPVDYVVNNIKIRHEGHQAGLYYECHRAEKVGTSAADDLLPPL